MEPTLEQMPLLQGLSTAQRRSIIDAGFERGYARGATVFLEGQAADAMYGVVEGQIKLVRLSSKGRELLMHLVQAGQTFAEAAFFAAGTYPATAEASAHSRLWCWPRERMLNLVREDATLAMAIMASMSRWTRRLASQLELLTQRRVEERLAVYLLARWDGEIPAEGRWAALGEAKHLIAAQCGTAPEVLSRTFRKLEADGVLEVGVDRLRVLDAAKLRALAEWIG